LTVETIIIKNNGNEKTELICGNKSEIIKNGNIHKAAGIFRVKQICGIINYAMKNKSILVAAAIMFFSVACNREMEDTRIESPREVKFTDEELQVLYRMRNENNRVNVEEATELANNVISFFDGEAAVKSGRSRKISSITPLKLGNRAATLKTRSYDEIVEFPDTAAYVFNFGNDNGYAIISADTRIEAPILAYAENGSLSEGTDNPGLGLFLEGAENYILRSIVEAEQKKDSLINSILSKMADENEAETKKIAMAVLSLGIRVSRTEGQLTTTARVTPLSPVEWGQGNMNNEPFRRNVRYKNCSSGSAPAGCVAVATAHIMSYWNYPTVIDGKRIPWADLNRYTGDISLNQSSYKQWSRGVSQAPDSIQTYVANLMEHIGREVKMKYGCGSSGAYSSDAINYLKRIGYKTGLQINYNYDFIKIMLNNRRPVYTTGCSYRTAVKFLGITLWYNYDGGHAWIIDGYEERRQQVTMVVEFYNTKTGQILQRSSETTFNQINYLRHNWGWHGLNNGYYVAGSFDSNTGGTTDITRSGTAYNYQYDVSVYLDIRR
jgi:hypothetical protein